jgi:hypothetical protein
MNTDEQASPLCSSARVTAHSRRFGPLSATRLRVGGAVFPCAWTAGGWSPDGSLVYKHGKQLVILTLADGKTVPLTDGSHYDNFPAWSPKGDVIMFISDRAGAFQLFTVRTDGTGVRQLTGMVLESGTPDYQPRRSLAPINSWMLTSSVG